LGAFGCCVQPYFLATPCFFMGLSWAMPIYIQLVWVWVVLCCENMYINMRGYIMLWKYLHTLCEVHENATLCMLCFDDIYSTTQHVHGWVRIYIVTAQLNRAHAEFVQEFVNPTIALCFALLSYLVSRIELAQIGFLKREKLFIQIQLLTSLFKFNPLRGRHIFGCFLSPWGWLFSPEVEIYNSLV
jgi:hypothetical protein